MFRAQMPPRPLDQATREFVKLLQEQCGQPAALESHIREFIALLNEETGHPVTILTRKRMADAYERAISRLLDNKG